MFNPGQKVRILGGDYANRLAVVVQDITDRVGRGIPNPVTVTIHSKDRPITYHTTRANLVAYTKEMAKDELVGVA